MLTLVLTKPTESCILFLTSCTVTLANNFLSWNPKFNYDIHNMATNHIWASFIHYTPTHRMYLRSILILSFAPIFFEVQRVVVHSSWESIALLSIEKSINTYQYFTVRRPSIVIYRYNKIQRDALFLKFILFKNSTSFGQIYCPSSGVSTLYTEQQVCVILVMLTVC